MPLCHGSQWRVHHTGLSWASGALPHSSDMPFPSSLWLQHHGLYAGDFSLIKGGEYDADLSADACCSILFSRVYRKRCLHWSVSCLLPCRSWRQMWCYTSDKGTDELLSAQLHRWWCGEGGIIQSSSKEGGILSLLQTDLESEELGSLYKAGS